MSTWVIVVNAETGAYADGLYGSIVCEDAETPGRFLGPAGWAGIRYAGTLNPDLVTRLPKNAAERKAVASVQASSDAMTERGIAHLDAQYRLAGKG